MIYWTHLDLKMELKGYVISSIEMTDLLEGGFEIEHESHSRFNR